MTFPDEEINSPRDFKRKTRYLELKGYKYITCGACNGSGYYDWSRNGKVPKCGCCLGKCKVWEKESR